MTEHNAGILGMGHAYPEGILTNADLEKIVETSDEWITSRTGIKQRHKAADNEYTSQFGTAAAKQALDRAGLKPTDIDIIVCATTTPDQIMPSTGALIQAQIGATNAAGMDVFAACSGFLYGLTMVESMIRTGQIKYALVIGAEVLTKYVDYTDRSTCVIFGDGAGAAVVGPVPKGKGILATKIRSDGRYEEQLYAPGGGTKLGTSHKTIDDGMHFFKMKGNELFKVAVRSMADISAEMLEKAGYTVDDVDLVIPHQANQRITDAVASRLGVPEEKVYSNIAEHGNTSSASIPIAIDECIQSGRIKEGSLVLLTAFGGGVTWGGTVIRF
ncbi:MAG: ketoacyl-ACP synthase III [Blastocatellia bacterium]|nr:ketoacyl-ACP synthase III [Chloracidobacterium sp.]MBL8186054.1 ketoacyl-ACP synthase III [Blastocatellia bacterium]HBE83598.1 3-oxoacyl-ACP synthase [Blastocatellia bacterium]HRJ89131.1 beta-ketoacyl-ACP synthase III [Pyrinomonadaceae bacterium]HRK50158.1 beta-ketoacyl-ACP synthase III [Pyrinomonadaceae bacterium]